MATEKRRAKRGAETEKRRAKRGAETEKRRAKRGAETEKRRAKRGAETEKRRAKRGAETEKRRAKRGAETEKRRAKRGAETEKRRATTKGGTREPLQPLAERYGLTLDELYERVRTTASAQVALAKSRAKLLRFKSAAEECVRAYAALDGIETGIDGIYSAKKGALLLGQILGIAEWEHPWPRVMARSGSFLEHQRETLARKRPWLLAALEACEGRDGPLYAGDNERAQAVQRRILLEFGASPNAIAASEDQAPGQTSVRTYASSAAARNTRRHVERLCRELTAEIADLKQKRQALLDGVDPLQPVLGLGNMAVVGNLDEQLADREDRLVRLGSRRRS